MSERPTPETDQCWDKYISHPYTYGASDLRILAQRLERERDELDALLAVEKATRNSIIEKGVKTERERDEAMELAQQMSESNQVLQAEVRDYRKTADNTPLSNNEMHLNLVLQEVAELAKTLKRERDEAREAFKIAYNERVQMELERNEARKDAAQLSDRLANTEDQLDFALICLRKHEGQLIEREP